MFLYGIIDCWLAAPGPLEISDRKSMVREHQLNVDAMRSHIITRSNVRCEKDSPGSRKGGSQSPFSCPSFWHYRRYGRCEFHLAFSRRRRAHSSHRLQHLTQHVRNTNREFCAPLQPGKGNYGAPRKVHSRVRHFGAIIVTTVTWAHAWAFSAPARRRYAIFRRACY